MEIDIIIIWQVELGATAPGPLRLQEYIDKPLTSGPTYLT